MGNLPNTKPKEHDDNKSPVALPKHNHPDKTRGAEKPAGPSGGPK